MTGSHKNLVIGSLTALAALIGTIEVLAVDRSEKELMQDLHRELIQRSLDPKSEAQSLSTRSIDRRPGILHPPSATPVGTNAALYDDFSPSIKDKTR